MIDVAANPSDAVEKALDLFGNDILRLAYSYMKSREDAEDIVQEVLIRLMQSAGVFEDESHEKGGVEFVQGQVKIGVQTEGGGNAGRVRCGR